MIHRHRTSLLPALAGTLFAAAGAFFTPGCVNTPQTYAPVAPGPGVEFGSPPSSGGVELGTPSDTPDDVTANRPSGDETSPMFEVPLSPVPPEGGGPKIVPKPVRPPDELELDVQVPSRKQVGSETKYVAVVRNAGTQDVDDVVLKAEFDPALVFPGRTDRSMQQTLGRMVSGETKELPLTLVSEEVGKHCVRFTVTRGGTEAVWKSVCVEFLPRRLQTRVVGPAKRTAGGTAEFNVVVSNVSGQAVDGLRVAMTHAATLKPKEVTAGATREAGRLEWSLGRLRAGEELQVQVEFACSMASKRSCVSATVEADAVPVEEIETCLEVAAPRGLLVVHVRDTEESVPVGEETVYEVEVRNRGLEALKDVGVRTRLPRNAELVEAAVLEGEEKLTVGYSTKGGEGEFEPVPMLAGDGVLTYRVRVKATRAGIDRFRAFVRHAGSTDSVEVEEPTTFNVAQP